MAKLDASYSLGITPGALAPNLLSKTAKGGPAFKQYMTVSQRPIFRQEVND
jgi:hypothetical protein